MPVVQGLQGVPIPKRIWSAVGLALLGLAVFTADPASSESTAVGDAACIAAAVCYALHLRLFVWGRRVTLRLITTKVAAQAALSIVCLALLGTTSTADFAAQVTRQSRDDRASRSVVWRRREWRCALPSGRRAAGHRASASSGHLRLGATAGSAHVPCIPWRNSGPTGRARRRRLPIAVLAATAPAPDADCDDADCKI